MNFVNTENSNTERILCSGIRRKAKHKLKGPEINYFSSLSKLKEKKITSTKLLKEQMHVYILQRPQGKGLSLGRMDNIQYAF